MKKETHFLIKGISQDLAYQLFNPQYAFEMQNIRINTTDTNSLLSMTNEQGTIKTSEVIQKQVDGTTQEIPVKVLGCGLFSDYVVLFSKSDNAIEPPHVDTYERIYVNSGDTLPLEKVNGEMKKVFTAKINGAFNVSVEEVSVKCLESVSTGLVDRMVGSVSYIENPMIIEADIQSTGVDFKDLFVYCNHLNCITISDYYAAIQFTPDVINLINSLIAPVAPSGTDKWLLHWNGYDIAGNVESYLGTPDIVNKYFVYNYADQRWYVTDNLNKVSITVHRTYPPATRMDYISVVQKNDNTRVLYEGDLNFQDNLVIHTVCVYENEDIQKVYWVDGVNSPRVANVAPNTWDDSTRNLSFLKLDFLPKLNYGEKITVAKSSGGSFPAGTVLYAFTYSDRNLQETNLFYVSPLYYSAQSAKGAAPDETCNIAFDITIENADTRFDYIQCYVIVRTSLNAQPAVYRISNIPCKKTVELGNTIKFTDNGYNWESYSPTSVLYKQLNSFVPKIITSKDSTLFLGNYSLESPFVKQSDVQSFLDEVKNSLHFEYFELNSSGGDYSYDLLNGGRAIKTFRSRQPYRIGIQFQDDRGTPTNILYLDDVNSASVPADYVDNNSFKQKTLSAVLKGSLINDNKLKRARLVMVDRATHPKNTIAQGILCPTVYRINDRVNNQPFAMSSWCMRGFNLSSLKDDSLGWPAESDAQWMTDMPLMSNLVKKGGEIANQTGAGLKGIKTINRDGGRHVSESTISLDSGSIKKTYYYLIHAYVEINQLDGAKKFYYHSRISRTTNPNVVTSRQMREDDQKDYYKDYTIPLWSIAEAAAGRGHDVYTSEGLKQEAMLDYKEKLEGLEEYSDMALTMIMQQWRLPNDFVERLSPYASMASYALGYGGRTDELSYNAAKIRFDSTNDFSEAIEIASTRPYFFCDHNVLTFHSPDVEANKQLIDNNKDVKYRIVGYTKIAKSFFNTYVKLERGPSNKTNNGGLQIVAKSNPLGIYNSPLWRDSSLYPTYLWHRNMSLGSQDGPDDDGKIFGAYSRKIFSNVHFCNSSYAMVRRKTRPIMVDEEPYEVINCDVPTASYSTSNYFPTMSAPRVFDSNEASALTLEGQENSSPLHSKLIYYGNVSMAHVGGTAGVPIVDENSGNYTESSIQTSDSCLIQYKSTPHVVMSMNYKLDGNNQYAPSLPIPRKASDDEATYAWRMDAYGHTDESGYLWSTQTHGYSRGYCEFSRENEEDPTGFIYIAELYQDLDALQIYGEANEDNLAKHVWIPISDWVNLDKNNPTDIIGFGDTFIGRWDCLKTYSFTESDLQSCVDITSFIVESDVNLQSRYDAYKGVRDGTVLNPQNFNLFNPVYDQVDNFFQYHYLKESEALNNFQNQVCWSDVKTLGESLDTWAQINVGNNLDFQGEYGQLRAGVNFANNLYFLQENAIYKMNYNTRVAISPTDGVPIQLSNNYSVDPPLLLKQFCGTDDLDKIVVSPNMAYFYDPLRGRINALNSNDQVVELSTEKAINSMLDGGIKRTFYDTQTKDILFEFNNSDKGSLAFNEDIQEFTSLYSYDGISSMFALDSKTMVTRDSYIWTLRKGDYNYFFTKYKPFYIDILMNQDPLKSKIFTNLDYTMVGSNDAEMSNAKDELGKLKPLDSFDILEVHTSYQENEVNLNALRIKPSNLKRKFRTWAIDIPRDKNNRDRMCDMWLRIKLKKNEENTNKYRINNVNATYYDV